MSTDSGEFLDIPATVEFNRCIRRNEVRIMMYFVDALNGRDGYDGRTPLTPWQTLDKVNATVFAPGDEIRFRCGCTFRGQLRPQGDGTAEAPIRIGTYGGGEKPIIDAGGTHGTREGDFVDGAAVLFVRIFLGAVFGNFGTIFYSAAGGFCAIAVTVGMKKLLTTRQLWVAGALGAMAHNIGQILAAMVLMNSHYIGAYLPYLLVVAIFTGFATGAAGAGILRACKAANIS